MRTLLWALLATMTTLAWAPAAHAASFDCTKATTMLEKAVCADPELSTNDETLATAYATALGGLSEAAAATVKATQHGWLDYAQRVCTADAQPATKPYTGDDALGCLRTAYTGRITDLEASRMLGGYRFYPVNRYLVEKDTDATADDYNKIADQQFTTVKLDGLNDVAVAFNAMIDASFADSGDLFIKGTDRLSGADMSTDIEDTTTVEKVTASRITLSETSWQYGHGAAHGDYGISYRHFLITKKRLLKAEDIFTGTSWKKLLGGLVQTALKDTLGDDLMVDDTTDYVAMAAEPSRWNFSDQGLIIQFQPYEVAAYAMGAPTVTIPWSKLSGVMSDEGTQIAMD